MARRMKKLAGWRPYDFDTMMGYNNEGALAFSYDAEDTDLISGQEVYNGQSSVFWKLIRAAYSDEIKAMYQELRSGGDWSYSKFLEVFQNHHKKWPPALKNEDTWYKYLKPLLDPDAGDSPTAEYLGMLQGDKEEHLKWWLYNRFRYADSKWNAGDALTDTVVLRAYAKANITVTPYASIYASVKYGSYLVQDRATRNQACTLVNPLDNVNDTETIIYSASQLADIGDLSGLKVGYASFVNASRINRIKLGDADANYSNPNLKTLYLGANELLQVLDVRNCPNLTGTVDASGAPDLEEVYFEGTGITGVILPNGGMLKKLHLPATVNNLDVRNQKKVTEFTIPSYSQIVTLRLENVSSAFNPDAIMAAMPANSRVRLVGFGWEFDNCTQAQTQLYDVLNTFRGLDEQGNNTAKAQVIGYIHVPSATGAEVAALKAQYPYIEVRADHLSAEITYKTWDDSSVIFTETVYDGGDGTKTNSQTRTSTAQNDYTPNGWSLSSDGTPDPDALKNVTEDRTVYAAYTATVRSYPITWVNNGTTLRTDTVAYGETPVWGEAMPTKDGQTASGWTPAIHAVDGSQTYTATYLPIYQVMFYNGSTLLYTDDVTQGDTATYSGATPVNSEDSSLAFLGWGASSSSTSADAVLTNIQANKSVYAVFESAVQVVEISDSWDTIIANIDNGTYKTKYKVGNYKPLDLGTEGIINMQIVAIDGDELASGGYAPLSFLGMELLKTKRRFNSNSTISWTNSEIRSVLINDIYPLFPSNIKNRVQTVIKTTLNGSSTTITNNETLFIPSARECINDAAAENSGVSYNQIYTIADNQPRIKSIIGESSPSDWLTRTQRSEYGYFTTTGNRTYSRYEYSEEKGVCLGFCL